MWHFYHLEFTGYAPETWIHHEEHPGDGKKDSIKFRFYWTKLGPETKLDWEHDAFLDQIRDYREV